MPPSDWLVASSPDPTVVAEVWGPEVVSIPLDDLTAAMDAAGETDVEAGVASLSRDATEKLEPSADDLTAVARVYEGLRALVATHRLDALTLRCFDLVLQRGTSGCFALSELTDAGVIAGCEGDIVSTVGLLWAQPAHRADAVDGQPRGARRGSQHALLAHCTVPRTMVDAYRLRSHFESGLGIGIQGCSPLGPVTLLRIGGSMMDALWLAEGRHRWLPAMPRTCAAPRCASRSRVAT